MKTYLEYIQRNLPEAVAMKVTKHEIKGLPDLIAKAIKNESQ
jgi:small subunit ribosomal protein S10